MLLAVMGSCDKEKLNNSHTFVVGHVELLIQDEAGNNLLDPSVSNHFSRQDIEVFYFKDGEKVLTSNVEIRTQRGFYTLFTPTEQILNNKGEKGEDITYLKLAEGLVDTIRTEWRSVKNGIYNTKIYYNGQLKWDRENEKEPLITIVK